MIRVIVISGLAGLLGWLLPGLVDQWLSGVPTWGGILRPSGTPGAILSRVLAAVAAVAATAKFLRARQIGTAKASPESSPWWKQALNRMDSGILLAEARIDERGVPVDARILEVSRPFPGILGVSPDACRGQSLRGLCPHLFEGQLPERLAQVIRNSESVRIDEFRCGSGEAGRHLEAVLFPVDGARFAVHLTDVTEIRKAEQALRESELRYRSLFHESRDGIYSVTRDGHFVEINQAGLEMLGIRREDLPGYTTDSFYADPAERVRFQEEVEKMGAVKDFEVTLYSRQGRPIICLLTSSVLRDSSGSVTGYHGIMHDITARKQADLALQESERRFRATFEQAAVGIAHVSLDGSLLSFNRKLAEMLGYQRDELLRLKLQELSKPGSKDEDSTWRQDLLDGQLQTFSVEKELLRKDRSPFWVTQTVSALRRHDGGLEYFIYVLADITEQKKLEEQYRQAQKMEALGRLAGGVAHDFNNLLTGLMGYSELALHEVREESAAAGYLAEVIELGRKARDLTGHLLTFSRPQSSRRVLVDVNQLIQADVKMLQRTLGEQIELLFDPGEGLAPVQVDPGQLEQVLLNLAINARDAMPDGGRLTIRTFQAFPKPEAAVLRSRERAQASVCIEIKDTGHGMDEATMERIFEPFFTTKGPGMGTGLGLAMVHGIITKHGGQVEVKSAPGQGASFTLALPAGSDPHLPAAAQHRDAVPEPAGGTETILVVEDEKAVRALIERVLTRAGYRVLVAAEAAEAMQIYREHRREISLLLSDIVMPGKSGVELSRALRRLEPGLKVVFVSGYMHLDDLAKAVMTSGDPLVQKPFRPAELLAKVREVLDRS